MKRRPGRDNGKSGILEFWNFQLFISKQQKWQIRYLSQLSQQSLPFNHSCGKALKKGESIHVYRTVYSIHGPYLKAVTAILHHSWPFLVIHKQPHPFYTINEVSYPFTAIIYHSWAILAIHKQSQPFYTIHVQS